MVPMASGVNPVSLVRALRTTYLRRGRRVGGSTITMQLARSASQSTRAPWTRKARANRARDRAGALLHQGRNSRGLSESRALRRQYRRRRRRQPRLFRKQPTQLSVAQALTLAVIPQSPRMRNPASPSGHEIALARARSAARGALAAQDIRRVQDFHRHNDDRVAPRHELPYRAPHLVDRVLGQSVAAPHRDDLDLGSQSLLELQLRHLRRAQPPPGNPQRRGDAASIIERCR